MSQNEDAPQQGREPQGTDALSPPPGSFERHDSARGDVPGVPTWPIHDPRPPSESRTPPVGLNWGVVAQRLGVDLEILEHDGSIVLAGEYFPEAGYFIDPASLQARYVDVGHVALRHGYFLGDLALSEVKAHIPIQQETQEVSHPVMPSRPAGAIIGLFIEEQEARRAKDRILQGSLGAGLSIEAGPLGTELRIERPELGGRVASVIAAHGGAVISIGGIPVAAPEPASGASATGRAMARGGADAYRSGTGVTGDVEGPAVEPGSSQERE